jgi:hypothetical protein
MVETNNETPANVNDVKLLCFYSNTNFYSLTIKNRLEEIQELNGGEGFFVFYEAIKNVEMFEKHKVSSVPTVVILRNDTEYARMMYSINPVKCAKLFVHAFKDTSVL